MPSPMGTTTAAVLPTPVARRGAPAASAAAFARRLLRTRLTPLAVAVLLTIVVAAVFAPVVAPYDPTFQDYASTNQGPSAAHWFGTDNLGRDILSRVIYGSRVSLLVGVVAVGIGLLVGVAVGVAAGFLGGKVDAVLMRATDAIWAFPALMLALTITSVLGRGVTNAMIAIGVVNIPFFARLARASTLAVRETDFVLAGRALGVSDLGIALRYVLPNIAATITVQASLLFAVAIITEAALSFLGVGVQPPRPSWGLDLRTGYQFMSTSLAQAFFPGLAIFVTVMAINFLGDGIRTALDPKLWRRADG
jgi:ABC-type dipeptide/oligopeptide/nickel transport system permease subunit